MTLRSSLQDRTRRLQRTTAAVAGFVLLGTALTACGGSPAEEAAETPENTAPTVLRMALDAEDRGWDPANQVGAGAAMLPWQPVYDTLLEYKPDGSITPNVAEAFEFNEDSTVLTLDIRDGITFTDGAPVDADAVKANIDYLGKDGSVTAGLFGPVEVAVVDENTVTITSEKPYPVLPEYLALQGTLTSPAVLESGDFTTPVGSGAYVLNTDESVAGTKLVFERNEDYWNADRYGFDRIEMLTMTDLTARINALQSGQIDAAPIAPTSADQVEAAGLELLDVQASFSGLLIVDRAGKLVPALGDVRVRQAINMVLDREAIMEFVYQGKGKPGNQVFNPNTSAYLEDAEDMYAYDVEAAQELMKDAGYADGFDLVLPEITNYTDQATSVIVEQLALLNIRAEVLSIPREQALARYLACEFPLFMYALPSGNPIAVIDAFIQPAGIWNVCDSSDPELQELIDEAMVTPVDEAQDAYQAVNQWVLDNAWFAVWGYDSRFWAHDAEVEMGQLVGRTTPHLSSFQPAAG